MLTRRGWVVLLGSLALIVTGQHTVENIPAIVTATNNPLRLGLAIIWSGNLAVLAIGVVLLTLIGRMADQGELSAWTVARLTLLAFGFVAVAIVLGSWLAPLLVRAIDRIEVARGLFFASIVFAFSFAWIAQRIGSAIIIGSFAAGLVLARTHKGREIEREVHDLSHFFVPIFFVVVGAAIDVRMLGGQTLGLGIGLAGIAVIGKILAGLLTPSREVRRLVVGAGMIPRGEVSLIFAQVGLTSGLLSTGLYNAVTIMVMITALLTPILLRALLTSRGAAESLDIQDRPPSPTSIPFD